MDSFVVKFKDGVDEDFDSRQIWFILTVATCADAKVRIGGADGFGYAMSRLYHIVRAYIVKGI